MTLKINAKTLERMKFDMNERIDLHTLDATKIMIDAAAEMAGEMISTILCEEMSLYFGMDESNSDINLSFNHDEYGGGVQTVSITNVIDWDIDDFNRGNEQCAGDLRDIADIMAKQIAKIEAALNARGEVL